MKSVKIILVLSIFVLMRFHTCDGFFARPGKDGNWRTKTHSDITNVGVFRALNEYIVDHKGATSIDDFFSEDGNGRITMFQKVGKLRQAVADTQTNKKDTAYIHCHADQIDLAHNHVKSCKQSLKQWIDDEDELLKQLGKCLYTVQSFYSNTNWVEMFGNVPYEDFGVNDLMDVATPDIDTCKDQSSYDSQCKDNIIVTNMLTSGYFHGRGNQKPSKPIGASSGKCSHGGKDDPSRTLVARCGINKDSMTKEYSPHNHLHTDAFKAAITATTNFLIANGTGILYIIGVEMFDSLFNVKKRTDKSLAIAIDYTSSMTDDIAAVKERVIETLTATVGSENEPADYVLSLFHDPATWNDKFLYVNGYDMIEKVKTIQAQAGENPDCPELAAAGMLNAIEICRSNSPLLVFTDAPAKDAHRLNEVITAAEAKHISISSLLTDQCGSKRSVTKGRFGRSLSFFQQIATATGGTVYQTDKDNIGNVLNGVLEGIFPSSVVMIQFSQFQSSTADYYFAVDNEVTVLKISVSGAATENDVSLIYPDGTQEDYSSGKSTKILSSGELILSIQNPPVGELHIHRNVNGDWTVNITAQSQLKMEVEILEQVGDGDLVTLQGNPIAGRNYTVSFSVYNMGTNSTCDSIAVVDTTGDVISTHNTSQLRRDLDTLCAASIQVQNNEFQLRLFGKDDLNNIFSRQLSTTYKPTNVELHIIASSDDLVVGRERSIKFIVNNIGTSSETYKVTITASNGNIQGASTDVVDVENGKSANGSFTLKATTPAVILSYAVSVAITSTSKIQQFIAKKIFVTDIERPDCTVITTYGVCGVESLNTANCSVYKWSAQAEVMFSGTTLNSLTSTLGQAVTLTHRNISGLTTGPLPVNISGDCCSPKLQISAVDVDGFITQCDLSFSDGRSVQSVEVVSSPINKESKEYLIIVAAMCTCFILITFVTIIAVVLHWYNLKKRALNKVEKVDTKPDGNKMEKFNAKHLYIS